MINIYSSRSRDWGKVEKGMLGYAEPIYVGCMSVRGDYGRAQEVKFIHIHIGGKLLRGIILVRSR